MAVKTNVNKNGNQYYRITRTIGHKADGKPIKKEFYGTSKSDAEGKANEYMSKLKNGLVNIKSTLLKKTKNKKIVHF